MALLRDPRHGVPLSQVRRLFVSYWRVPPLTTGQSPAKISPMKDAVIDGAAVRARRQARGWSRFEFARLSGVSISYLKIIESQPPADCRWPSDRITAILAATLDCEVADISIPDEQAAAA